METDKLLSEFIGMIVRMKALNPLISDELVSIVSTLKKDAAIVLASLTAIVENDGGDKAGTDERV